MRQRPGRIVGLVQQLTGRADHALCCKLGTCRLVLIPAPVAVAALVDCSRRSEELIQALVEQHVFTAVLFCELTGWRSLLRAGSVLTAVRKGRHRLSRWQPLGCRMGCPKFFRMP